MPIRPELRHLYSGPKWAAKRARILEREGNKCKLCRVPNYKMVARINRYRGWWFTMEGEAHNQRGELCFHFRGSEFDAPDRIIKIRLTVAHLNQTPGDDRDENLAALCQAPWALGPRRGHWSGAQAKSRVVSTPSRQPRLSSFSLKTPHIPSTFVRAGAPQQR